MISQTTWLGTRLCLFGMSVIKIKYKRGSELRKTDPVGTTGMQLTHSLEKAQSIMTIEGEIRNVIGACA